MSLFARDSASVERLVRLFHASTADGTVARCKLTLDFAHAIGRAEADAISDVAVAAASKLLGAAPTAADLTGGERDMVASIRARLRREAPLVKNVELGLFSGAHAASGLRQRILTPEVEIPSEVIVRPVADAARIAARRLSRALLEQHETMLRWDIPTVKVACVSAEEADRALGRRGFAAPRPAGGSDETRWRAELGDGAVERIHDEAAVAAMYLVYEVVAALSPRRGGAASNANNALVTAIAHRAFPDLPVARGLSRYLHDADSPLQTTLASAAAEILGAADHAAELADALVWLLAGLRDDIRDAAKPDG